MGIFSFLSRRRTARLVTRSAAEVAERSYPAVMDRVRRRASTMRVAEARGYVKSRALDLVHRELAAIHNGKIPLDPATQTQIISKATETLVASVLAELRNVPKAGQAERAESGIRRPVSANGEAPLVRAPPGLGDCDGRGCAVYWSHCRARGEPQ